MASDKLIFVIGFAGVSLVVGELNKQFLLHLGGARKNFENFIVKVANFR